MPSGSVPIIMKYPFKVMHSFLVRFVKSILGWFECFVHMTGNSQNSTMALNAVFHCFSLDLQVEWYPFLRMNFENKFDIL